MDNFPKRKQRTACDICRRRKVRCDIAFQPTGACSACRRSGTECQSTAKWSAARRTLTDPCNARPRGGSGRSHYQLGDSSSSSSAPPLQRHAQRSDAEDAAEQEQEQLARGGLARFFKHGISDGGWAVFDSPDKLRIAYVGTASSNIAHLVDLHRSSPQRSKARQESAETEPEAGQVESLFKLDSTSGHGRMGAKPLHYPYPPIRQSKAWRPNTDVFGITSSQNLLSDVSSVPEPEIRDALVNAYFEHIHPFLPFLSKGDFLDGDGQTQKQPPLLLYQSVLMAGAHACSHPVVARDRQRIKSILFRRASMLFHIRHETDRTHLMQAATLFTWHTGDGDTVTGGPYYWSGVATRIGCGLGAHRRGTALQASDSLQFKISWWSAFVCDVFSSLDTGRPNAIRPEEIDQLPISVCTDTAAPTSDTMAPESSLSENDPILRFLKSMVDLAYIGLDIIAENAPSAMRGSNVTNIDAQLGVWCLRTGIFSDRDDDDAWSCQLRIHYHLLLLYLHRNFSEELGSKSVCSVAAQAIVALFEQLAAMGCLKQCHFTAVSAMTAAGIQIVTEIRSAVLTGTHSVAVDALGRLARLSRSAEALAEYWLNAESVRTVFQELHQEYEACVLQFVQGNAALVPEKSPDWHDLLTGSETPLKEPSNVEDWMSIIDWNNI
ncbi:fungal-specific transcription factor domain-containing protein [Dactylonectria macrodidyma]|uniref:Fungal-specific transcription factor domain-containing protein n=1 Tax=Dactylonectria macrodidyma TaxID=307937 RepID=A0A9P9JIF2_9HYPO|nr:fungal-specific transcription factor domain-containing protein [Dactylonectria macrodidyma]